MQKERFKIVPTSHLVLIKDGRILLSRRFNTGYEDGKYSVIAGHVDGGETFIEAMIREAKEESGIILDRENLEVVHVMHRRSISDERVDLFIRAKKWLGEPSNMEPHKCDDMRWFPINKLPANTIPYVRQAVEKIQNRIIYSEHGW